MTQTTIPDEPNHPSAILLNLIVALLAPMFLTASNGNIAYARLAAMQTVNAYRAQSHADLITIAQIIAFGLAALGSLSLSLTDGLSVPMTLRLRANANACNRSAEQNRNALNATCPQRKASATAPPAAPPPPTITDHQRQTLWAEAAARVAAEYTADLPNLPPAERRAAEIRAAMLTRCAQDMASARQPSASGPAT